MASSKTPSKTQWLIDQVSDFSSGLSKAALTALASRVGGLSLKIGRSLILNRDQLSGFSAEQRAWMQRAGDTLKDARQAAGLTLDDLRDALNLHDKNLLEAIEQGSATLSFEMILRLTSLVARNDPLPFLIHLVRGFNPQLWALLEDWGFGHLPTMVERDRQWLNLYRSQEQARRLSDNEFQHLLAFSREALSLALAFKEPQDTAPDKKKPR
ncbi:MAG: XRE family transcriptional regulator [Alcanivorax sp.]|nr:XRE family transcriptional regulator [Alcanivorax sp.]